MIQLATPTVSPVANIVSLEIYFAFLDFERMDDVWK